MSGYLWDPVVKIVPQNGAETVYWFTDELSDLGGHRKIGLSYPDENRRRMDINRVLRPVEQGVRPKVHIDCLIVTLSDQAFLSYIREALKNPRQYDVFLSLDGGCTYRKVVSAGSLNPDPIADKTCVGANFRLSMECAVSIPYEPPMMTDPGVGAELVQNGGFEDWDPSNLTPHGWTGNAHVTLAKQGNPGYFADGAWSCETTKTGLTGDYGALIHSAGFRLDPGAWYRLRAKALGGQTTSLGLAVQLWNQSYPNSTGALPFALGYGRPIAGQSIGLWSTGAVVTQDISAASFASIDVYFRGPRAAPFAATDLFQFRIHGIQTSGHKAYYDSMSIFGPVLRPGYATW